MDSAVYGGINSYSQQDAPSYTSFSDNAPKFGKQAPSSPKYATAPTSHYGTSTFKPQSPQGGSSFCPTTNTTAKPYSPSATAFPSSPRYGSASSPKYDYDHYSNAATKAFETLDNDYIARNLSSDFQTSANLGSDGYRTSEYSTNTSKIPGGYKTDSYKYESYHSSSQPIITSTTEKYYTSTPEKFAQFSPLSKEFGGFGNGTSDYQTSYSSNVEVVNEPPVIKDTDSLEQKMLKKSVTQQIIEKKTVATTKSTKQESSTKSFRFE